MIIEINRSKRALRKSEIGFQFVSLVVVSFTYAVTNRSAYDSLKFLGLIVWFLLLLLRFGLVSLYLFPQLALKLFGKPSNRFVSRYPRLSCP